MAAVISQVLLLQNLGEKFPALIPMQHTASDAHMYAYFWKDTV